MCSTCHLYAATRCPARPADGRNAVVIFTYDTGRTFWQGLHSLDDFVPTGVRGGLGCGRADHAAFGERDLSGSDYVYVWADGIHLLIRLREAKSCVLVLMGVRADGTKELISMSDGYRESADSWADLLRDSARRSMRALVLAVGDGALGFWTALAEVFPETRHQRCWVHKIANVANALPKSAQPGAKKPCRR
jgi:transposase-like protein